MVFVELPLLEMSYSQGDACAVFKPVKVASDIYTPVPGEVVLPNGELEGSPEHFNSDPCGDGWLFCMVPSDAAQIVVP